MGREVGREKWREVRWEKWWEKWREERPDSPDNDDGTERNLKTGGCGVGRSVDDNFVGLADIAGNSGVLRVGSFGDIVES